MTDLVDEDCSIPAAVVDADLSPITEPYLLVSGIAVFVDKEGERWIDDLWHKDLVEHLVYIKDLTLAAPVRRLADAGGALNISSDHRFTEVKYVDLPASDSLMGGVANWPVVFLKLWKAVGKVRFVHAGVAEWPIPLGWAATIAAKLRRRPLLINIESSFWRSARNASLARRAQSWLWERVNRWCVRRADLPLFTQREFARQMLRVPDRAHIFQASWIDACDLATEAEARASWDRKDLEPQLRLLFAGRLVPEKGVRDLLAAFRLVEGAATLDFIGAGELAAEVRHAAEMDPRIRLLEPVPYDSNFFQLIRQYHALVLPSRTDEQPRVAYDSYSQAVPILATSTAGNAECVTDGETGLMCPPQDISAITALIEKAIAQKSALRTMGLNALAVAGNYTHQEMHRRRWNLLMQFMQERNSTLDRTGDLLKCMPACRSGWDD